mmetsp:Transcript_4843/g.14360  ORF Transcript_4843/g.14360 Transcript_4843/m.14360 type:complete len:392 (-) Transcript_4843:623-1798(-)
MAAALAALRRLRQQSRRFSGSTGALWTKLNALGARPGAINMGQGFPDFAGSAVARAAAKDALDDPALNQYAPINGLASLREEVASFYARQYDSHYDPASEIIVTTSGQEALVAALTACFKRTGKSGVVVSEPLYPFLIPAIAAAGGTMQPARLAAPDFALDAAALEEAADESTAVAVINSPQNPTGRVFTADELDAFAAFCKRRDIFAISDEVYEHACFPGHTHRRLADVAGMRERTITLSSAGKLYSLTGWRVGWALAPADIAMDVSNAHTALTYSAPTPLQHGIAEALRVEDGSFGGIGALFARNYEVLAAALVSRGIGVAPAQGGYFLVADAHRPDMAFVEALAEETGVVCTPLSVFYASPPEDNTWVRFTICKSAEYIDRAAAALAR